MSIDLASFYNVYDDLRTIETGDTVATPYVRAYADLPYAVDFAGEFRYVGAIVGQDNEGARGGCRAGLVKRG